MPEVSIIIPTFNSSCTIKKCLDSILSQTFSDYEIIVMDGLSNDTTLDIVREYSIKNIFIFSEKDNGVYDAMNKAIDKARGKWLYFIGSDDLLYNNRVLENVVNLLIDRDYDILYGNAYFIGKKYFHAGFFTRERLMTTINICHQAIFYKKDIFNRLGKFNPDFPVYADWDFNIRCFSTPNLNIRYLNSTIVYYNDISGISKNTQDENFNRLYAFNSIKEKNRLNFEYNNLLKYVQMIEKSFAYKIGKFILRPFNILFKLK